MTGQVARALVIVLEPVVCKVVIEVVRIEERHQQVDVQERDRLADRPKDRSPASLSANARPGGRLDGGGDSVLTPAVRPSSGPVGPAKRPCRR